MLAWWIVSFIILIACFVFAYKMIVGTYEFLPADKRYFLRFSKNRSSNEELLQPDALRNLRKKVQTVEDSATYQEIQFSKLQERLKVLEDLNKSKLFIPEKNPASEKSQDEYEEGWKEMYYEENARKEKLENDLDISSQRLEEAEEKLKNFSENSSRWVELQSEYELRLHDIQSLQNNIDFLRRQLEAGTEREKELEELLLSEITLREKHLLLQKEFIELQSEADDLRRRVLDLNKKDIDLQIKALRVNELESKLAICEEEKIKLKARLEKLL